MPGEEKGSWVEQVEVKKLYRSKEGEWKPP